MKKILSKVLYVGLSVLVTLPLVGCYLDENFSEPAYFGDVYSNGERLTPAEEQSLATHDIDGAFHNFPEGDGSTFLSDNGTFSMPGGGPSGNATWGTITGTLSNQTDLQSALDDKQATLVSGTNIKTINGSTLLGAGDLVVSAGDHSHTADNITGGSANQTILSVGGRGSWTTLLMEHISGLVAALAGKLAATAAAIVSTLGYQPADNVTAIAHYGDVSNPHSVTAAQVGALPTANVTVAPSANKVPSANGGGTINPDWVPTFTASANGTVTASGGGTSNFLRADGTWAEPGGSTPVFRVMSADSATTSTSLVDIGGLYVLLDANSTYMIEAAWNETTTGTAGIRFGASYNATLSAMAISRVFVLVLPKIRMRIPSTIPTPPNSVFHRLNRRWLVFFSGLLAV